MKGRQMEFPMRFPEKGEQMGFPMKCRQMRFPEKGLQMGFPMKRRQMRDQMMRVCELEAFQ